MKHSKVGIASSLLVPPTRQELNCNDGNWLSIQLSLFAGNKTNYSTLVPIKEHFKGQALQRDLNDSFMTANASLHESVFVCGLEKNRAWVWTGFFCSDCCFHSINIFLCSFLWLTGTTSRRCSLSLRGVAFWEQPSFARCVSNEYRQLQHSVGAKPALFIPC